MSISFNVQAYSKNIDYPMVEIPKGVFTMQIPVYYLNKIVYIKKEVEFKQNFFIGKYEVSNHLWNQCYRDKGCSKDAFYNSDEGLKNPSVRLNWHDAFEFSKWISKSTGKKYRLPTEEEWVYSAVLGDESTKIDFDKEVIYDYNSAVISGIAEKITKPIGSINSNKWGMYDFLGNVWEWTLTCWFSSRENILKERSISELNSPSACTTRIARGETRSHIPDFISDTYSGGCATLRPAANLGFRLVREK